MHKHRLPYAAAFRQQMIDLVHAGRTPEDLAKEFGPTAQTIYNNWVAQADSDTGKRHDGLTTTEREELTRLRRKVKQLEVEKEIQAVANALNTRPRKTLGWKTPAEALDEYLKSVQVVLRRPVESAQYTSIAFGLRCREAGVRPSMGSGGDAYDNAMWESFFATLECELLARRRFATHEQARLALFTCPGLSFATRI